MKTIAELLIKRTELSPKENSVGVLGVNNAPVFLSFKDYYKKIESLSLAFSMVGIKPQETVAIWGRSCLNWHLADMAIMCSGSVTVPIHHDISKDEFNYIWNHCDADYLILDDLNKYHQFLNENSRTPKKIILLNEKLTEVNQSHILIFNNLMQLGFNEVALNPDLFERKLKGLSEDHIATIVYTSGTTNKPKGAVIKHAAIIQVLSNLKKFSQKSITYKDRFVSCLPLSHILGRCESFFSLNFGCECVFVPSAKVLLKNIKSLRPSFLVLVPQILEHLKNNITDNLTKTELHKLLFETAQKKSLSYYRAIDKSENPHHTDLILHQLSLRFIYNNIHQELGGKIRYIITGGAPLQKEIFLFFRNIKISILEGYGLTETFAPCTVNTLHKQYPETVGVPIGDVKIKFSPDGEIYLNTKALFTGYYKDEESTSKALENNWFKTGDIGEFTKEGCLKITGRKKDIIINKGGKNIIPYNIEYALNKSPYINFSYIYGEGKEYLTALIAIVRLKCISDCENISEDFSDEQLALNSDIKNLISSEIARINKNLSKAEQIKDFRIIPVSNASEFHTISLKMRRSKVLEKYGALIKAMY